jgi:hypothetical protein
MPAILRPSAKMESGQFQLFPVLALTPTLSVVPTPTRPIVLTPTLVTRLIALLVLFLHDGITRLVTVALLIKFTLLLHLPGILIP